MIVNLFGALVMGLLLTVGLAKRAHVAHPVVVEQPESVPEGIVMFRYRHSRRG